MRLRIGGRATAFEIRSVGALEDVREEWDALANTAENIFATYEWAAAWWANLSADAALLLAACRRDDGSIAGLLPLVVSGERRLRVVRLLSDTGPRTDWHHSAPRMTARRSPTARRRFLSRMPEPATCSSASRCRRRRAGARCSGRRRFRASQARH